MKFALFAVLTLPGVYAFGGRTVPGSSPTPPSPTPAMLCHDYNMQTPCEDNGCVYDGKSCVDEIVTCNDYAAQAYCEDGGCEWDGACNDKLPPGPSPAPPPTTTSNPTNTPPVGAPPTPKPTNAPPSPGDGGCSTYTMEGQTYCEDGGCD